MKKYISLFWLTFVSMIILLVYSYYRKTEYESDLSRKNWQINDYQFDIRMINKLMFETDRSKHQIDSLLIAYDQSDGDYFKITKDTVFLNETFLLFQDNELKSIQNQSHVIVE